MRVLGGNIKIPEMMLSWCSHGWSHNERFLALEQKSWMWAFPVLRSISSKCRPGNGGKISGVTNRHVRGVFPEYSILF